jgi:hypothetical protein
MEASEASAIQSSADFHVWLCIRHRAGGLRPARGAVGPLRVGLRSAEEVKAELAAVQRSSGKARSENRAIHKEVYTGFGVKVAGVLRAAKTEGVRVQLGAQRQGRACLSGAREEAGEILAAARREAARIRAQAEGEGNRSGRCRPGGDACPIANGNERASLR